MECVVSVLAPTGCHHGCSICHGEDVPPVVRHVTCLHLGEWVGDEALEVSIILQCRTSSRAGFLGESHISCYLKVLLYLISQVAHEPPFYQLTHERLIQ